MAFSVVQVLTTQSSPIWVAMSGSIDAVFSGTQIVTSSQASPVWITSSAVAGGGTQYGTGSTTPYTGTLSLGNYNGVATAFSASSVGAMGVTASLTNPLSVAISGTMAAVFATGSTATVTNVTVSATSVSILAANANRLAAAIQNTTAQATIFYVKLGTTASPTSMTVRIGQNGYYELPGRYTGIIHAIASGTGGISTGTLGVTEITA